MIDPESAALAREAGIAAELLGVGVTALGRASSSQDGYYNQAFFNLSIGFERAAKLALILDYCIDHTGAFPLDAELRRYGHDVQSLLEQSDVIAQKRRAGREYSRLPNTDIHAAIVSTLSEFAKATRYYNLDYLSQGKGASLMDPIEAWYLRVGEPILRRHLSARIRMLGEHRSKVLQATIGEVSSVHHHTETGERIDNIEDLVVHGLRTKVIQRYGQLYTLQIIRHLAFLISDLQFETHKMGIQTVPYLIEFFAMFMNDDKYFKSRRTWSIYRS